MEIIATPDCGNEIIAEWERVYIHNGSNTSALGNT